MNREHGCIVGGAQNSFGEGGLHRGAGNPNAHSETPELRQILNSCLVVPPCQHGYPFSTGSFYFDLSAQLVDFPRNLVDVIAH
jgi:hypothetical protein